MEPQEDLQRFRPFLKALANQMLYADLRQKLDASDLVQQTMLKAIEAQSQYRGESDAEKAGWLKAILWNLARGLLRRYHSGRREIAREKELASFRLSHAAMNIPENLPSPSYNAQMDEEKERMLKVLESLTLDQRRAILLRYWEDKSLEEIGAVMDKKPEAIAGLIYRGMKVLRTEIER
ncbi:MAG: sigma-70 family RNA polymerase sigma factor [Planctomycetaceae bacterium]|jgi:RNA polymerase sigma-70 factor (ECF subfamily)|nr:sigma-70 family RNA polymerase sigma factor [Planctomycetaceae bacterium]